jgi:hypothetical protein
MDIEDVHEDGKAAGAAGKKCGLLGFDQTHHFAIGGSQDEAVSSLSRALRIPKEGNDPDRQHDPENAHDPEEPRIEAERDENEAQCNHPGADDEPKSFGGSAHQRSCSRSRPVSNR